MRRPTVHLVHGFNTTDAGAGTIDKLRPYFEDAGFDVADVDYGWVFLLTLRWRNRDVARSLAKRIKPGDVLVGHSNGCAIIDLCLSEYCTNQWVVDGMGVIYINPALRREQPVPAGCDWMHVYSAKSDEPVQWGSWLRKFSPLSWFIAHPWGAMGRYGYQGDDPRVEQTYMDAHAVGKGLGHSGVFSEPYLDFFGDEMAEVARAAAVEV